MGPCQIFKDSLIMEARIYDHREATDDNGYLLYDSPNELDVICLFYDREKNKFLDEDGFIVWDIYRYITPTDVYLFKSKKECMFVTHRSLRNTLCELYYPMHDDHHDKIYSIYYNSESDTFEDDCGVELHSIDDLITPNQLRRHKEIGGTLYIPSRTNPRVKYEIVFPIEGDEDYA